MLRVTLTKLPKTPLYTIKKSDYIRNVILKCLVIQRLFLENDALFGI